MSFNQIALQKEYFFRLYITIENIANIGHMFCCCQVYSGCQTIQIFLKKQKDTVAVVNLLIDTVFILFMKQKRTQLV